MNLWTIDFETYYASDYTLSKISTEDYVNDPRFEIILVGVKKNSGVPAWKTGTLQQIRDWFDELGVWDGAWICHNAMFDALIAIVHFGKLPKLIIDTLCMAQAITKPYSRSISLDSCLKFYSDELGGRRKGTEVHNMLGRTRASLSKQEMQRYATYCMDDCEGEYALFNHLKQFFPREELEIMDLTLRMYLQPRLKLDMNLLCEILQEAQAKKAQVLAALPAEITEKMVGSNKQFAELLTMLGVDVPMKISPTTGLQTFAFSKTDTGFKELEEMYEDDPIVSTVLAARLGVKSTIEESRTERLIEIARKYKYLRVPLRYYAAHTGRYGGMEKINMQNPPQIGKSRLRFAFVAPKGYVVLGLDLAQIEARITAWLCGAKTLVEGFRNKEDVYSNFATVAFKCETIKGRSKEDDKRRFVGKTCILGLGYGMGDTKLRATLRKDNVKASALEVAGYVSTYRKTYNKIPEMWRKLDTLIKLMASGGTHTLGPVTFSGNKVLLPNGMELVYHNLRYLTGEGKGKLKGYTGWVYDYAGEVRTLWGGKLLENIVQALARILVMTYMVKIRRQVGIRPALQVHDELDYVVREDQVEELGEACAAIMRTPEPWCPDLPVDVEYNWGASFGDCK